MTVIAIVGPHPDGTGSDGPDDSDEAFEKLVRAVSEVVPLVHVRRDKTLLMSARGPARFYGSLEAAVAHLHAVCGVASVETAAPVSLGVGAAASQFAATVAAHASAGSGSPRIVPSAQAADFLGTLSVRWLALDDQVAREAPGILERLGLRDLAAVRALGERAMIDRFGAGGARMHLLAAGGDPDPLVTGVGAGPIVASWHRAPDDPGDWRLETTVAATRGVCEKMFADLFSRGRQCIAVRITVVGERRVLSDRVWHEPRGLSAQSALERLGRQITPASGAAGGTEAVPVEVRFEAAGIRALSGAQGHLWERRTSEAERVVRALSMMRALDAGARIAVPRRRGARDLPEMYRLEETSQVGTADVAAALVGVRDAAGPVAPWPGALPSPSPATLWPEALPAEVLDAAGASVGVTGRHELTAAPAVLVLGGAHLEVLGHGGPWPLEERWWDPGRRRRAARLQLLVREDGDETVHLVCLEHGRWHAVARYD